MPRFSRRRLPRFPPPQQKISSSATVCRRHRHDLTAWIVKFLEYGMTNRPKRKRCCSPIKSPEPSEPATDPYPDFSSPSAEQCRAVRDALLAYHGFPDEFSKYRRGPDGASPALVAEAAGDGALAVSVLDGLVSTLLSQNTTELNSGRAFRSLKAAFTSWDQVLDAESKLVEDAIRCGGLAATKAARIKNILRSVKEKRGEICLEYLRTLSIDEVKAELSKFKGIGPKTVACVLMFYLQRDDFPVDTHVYRITKDIGWIPIKADRERAYLHLNCRIPNELKFDLNCLFVTHGKLCRRCARRGNNEQSGPHAVCPLINHSHNT